MLDRAVKVCYRERGSDGAADWKGSDTKRESTRPRSPRDVVKLLLQNGVRAVRVDPHLERDLSFFIRIPDSIFHSVAVAIIFTSAFPNVLDGLFGAPQEFHNSFRNVGNRLRRISGDVPGRVERAFGRGKE